MDAFIAYLKQPWPWYIAGPLIGLMVPALLIAGNKMLGISSTIRQLHDICLPAYEKNRQYDWKKDRWNLFFVFGILIGGFIAGCVFGNPQPVKISNQTVEQLQQMGIQPQTGFLPAEIFSWKSLLTIRGILIVIAGGFLIGFGTRYGGGCTSGHGIMGLSSLQFPSLLAVISFFAGGIITSWFILPVILKL